MGCYILVSNQSWHIIYLGELKGILQGDWHFINRPEELTPERLNDLQPEFVFFFHWSYKIKADIYLRFSCIVFHMTDLPYGRGGSPLQNLIVRGHKNTKISAIRVEEETDAGAVYLKRDLDLSGSANTIFARAADIMKEMVVHIVQHNPIPLPQTGEPVFFKRRIPQQSNLKEISDMPALYDHIRMLDADGYPHAFLDTEFFRFEFTNVSAIENNTISAHVKIIKK